jgi:hypothetical protein
MGPPGETILNQNRRRIANHNRSIGLRATEDTKNGRYEIRIDKLLTAAISITEK